MKTGYTGEVCSQKSNCIFLTDEENESVESAILGALSFNMFENVPKFTRYTGSTSTSNFQVDETIEAAWKKVPAIWDIMSEKDLCLLEIECGVEIGTFHKPKG